MVEKWIESGWKTGARWIRSLFRHTGVVSLWARIGKGETLKIYSLYRHFIQSALATLAAVGLGIIDCRKKPAALAITVIVPLAMFAFHLMATARVAARQPAHMAEIIQELSNINFPNGKVVPNHANSKLLYTKFTGHDTWGVYLLDIASKNCKLVYEINKGYTQMRLLGWSPHDEYFAYARQNGKEVVICDGSSGEELGNGDLAAAAAVPKKANKKAPKNKPKIEIVHNEAYYRAIKSPISSAVWLDQALLCSDGNQIAGFSKIPNGWEKETFVAPRHESVETNPATPTDDQDDEAVATPSNARPDEIRSLALLGTDSVVWQRANSIYIRNQTNSPQLLWQATNGTLLEFSVSSSPSKFLLHCQDENGDFLVEYYPRILSGKVDVLTNYTKLDTSEYKPMEVQWINDGKGYAYLNQSDVASSKLVIKITSDSQPLELPWKHEIIGFYINGLQLYGITASAEEPQGIWRCDLKSGANECLVSSLERPFKYAANALTVEGFVTNAAGEKLTYYLLEPVTRNEEKHPLVIAGMGIRQLGNNWDRMTQGISNLGGYVLRMDRRKRSPGDWAADSLCAYDYLAKHYPVDTNNVYLYGVSAGAYTSQQLLEMRPGLWKGAFLIAMNAFPHLSQSRVQSILLDVGDIEVKKDMSPLLQSQEQLSAAGIAPTLVLRRGAGHIPRGIKYDQERMEQLGIFIHQP